MWREAKRAEPGAIDRATRIDLLREIDWLCDKLAATDLALRSEVQVHRTRLRALADALVPKPPPPLECAIGGCRIRFQSEAGLREHRRVVHWEENP